jgi:hypothetical protein
MLVSQVFDIEDESDEVGDFSYVAARQVPVGTARFVGSMPHRHIVKYLGLLQDETPGDLVQSAICRVSLVLDGNEDGGDSELSLLRG